MSCFWIGWWEWHNYYCLTVCNLLQNNMFLLSFIKPPNYRAMTCYSKMVFVLVSVFLFVEHVWCSYEIFFFNGQNYSTSYTKCTEKNMTFFCVHQTWPLADNKSSLLSNKLSRMWIRMASTRQLRKTTNLQACYCYCSTCDNRDGNCFSTFRLRLFFIPFGYVIRFNHNKFAVVSALRNM